MNCYTDPDAEKVVIGWFARGYAPSTLKRVAPDICPKWFPTLGDIYRAAESLEKRGLGVNQFSLKDQLTGKQLEAVGGIAALNPGDESFSVVEDRLEKLRHLFGKRAVAELSKDMAEGMQPAEAIRLLQPLVQKPDVPREPNFTDLSKYLEGTLELELPTVAESFAGHYLFYAGRLNEIHAEPSTGKTNVIVAAAIRVLEIGGSVLYVDPEDTPRGIVTRFLMLGANPDDLRERLKYLHNPDPQEIRDAQSWAKEHKPSLVILDGLAESMAAVGADENSAADVLQFFRENLRPFAEASAAVVIADHVTKSTEGRGQFARGSGAKAGRYDGVSYEIVMAKSYTPKVEGMVKLKVQKDRNGGIGPRGFIAAELHFTPGADGRTITAFREPAEKQEGPFRPTAIMEKIRKHLTVYDTATKRTLRDLGNHKAAELAIDLMVTEGEITMSQKGQSQIFSLKKAA